MAETLMMCGRWSDTTDSVYKPKEFKLFCCNQPDCKSDPHIEIGYFVVETSKKQQQPETSNEIKCRLCKKHMLPTQIDQIGIGWNTFVLSTGMSTGK